MQRFVLFLSHLLNCFHCFYLVFPLIHHVFQLFIDQSIHEVFYVFLVLKQAKTSTQGPKLTQEDFVGRALSWSNEIKAGTIKLIMVGRRPVSSSEAKEARFRWTKLCVVQRIQSRKPKSAERQDFAGRAVVWSNEQKI